MKILALLLALIQFNVLSWFAPADTYKGNVEKNVDNYNYILGTQTICPGYKFTTQSEQTELGSQILAMGSNMLKIETGDTGIHKYMDQFDFKYVFMWYNKYNLHKAVFLDGLSEEEKKADYEAVYNFTKTLLTKYSGRGCEFYIGNWETDWYYIDELDENGKPLHGDYFTGVKNVDDARTEAMIQWINNRQQAIDDAKRDTEYENVEVWGYLEVNRVQDAFQKGYDRVVNKVLPHANVDFVSYSAYDSMDLPAWKVRQTINKINKLLPEKDNIPGSRVLIGEFAKASSEFGYDDAAYTKANLEILRKYLTCNVKFVLFWEMYCNTKLTDGNFKGFWLIDSDGNETGLYKAYSSMLAKGKTFVQEFEQKYGTLPSEKLYRLYLLTLPELYGK